MTQYNNLNVKPSNLQFIKSKSMIENEIEVVLILSSNMVGDDETNFPPKLILTNRHFANYRKVFANYLSTDIKLSKTQIPKMIQSREFLGRLLGPLLKTGLPLMQNEIKPLTKNVLISLELNAALSAADAGIHKNILGSGTTTLIISNDEIKDIIRIIKSLEDSVLLLKEVSEKIQNEAKEQKGGLFSMLLGTLVASLLVNILASKGINSAGEEVIRAGYENKRKDHKNKMDF